MALAVASVSGESCGETGLVIKVIDIIITCVYYKAPYNEYTRISRWYAPPLARVERAGRFQASRVPAARGVRF